MKARVLDANIDGLWAEEVLRDRGGDLTPQAVKSLTMLATGDKKESERAWVKAQERKRDRDMGFKNG